MRLKAGQRVGPYEIVAPLGAGGMGEVYRARDTRLRREVALKLIPSQPDDEARTVDRFRREAYAASALNHPNIITIHEIGDLPEGRFIAMELVDGHTLRHLMNTTPTDAIPRLGGQVARALAVAHEAGIAHRDIKPENIMVRPDGLVKVLDFGLARFFQERVFLVADETTARTEAQTLLGTVRYMSPEQARGEDADRPADVFALGVVLYELSTGTHPFEADSPLGVLHAIASQIPVAPARISPGIPARLDDLILRMLAQDSRRRPAAAEVARELDALDRAGSVQEVFALSGAKRRGGVGRMRERAELQSALESVTAGRGLLVTVAGEAGIGKTTVIEDFLFELQSGDRRYRIARGRCSERLAGTEAYLPFLEALDDLIHQGRSESVVRQVKSLAPTWYEQLKPMTGGRSSESLPAAKAASPERFKFELATLLHEASRHDTIVFFFDDLHWSDVSTVDLLSYLATRFDSTRLLILAAYRPSDLLLSRHPFASVRLELQGRGLCREISLPFLERQDVDAYLAREFPGHRFPPELGVLIHRRTEGSPLFMVDLIRELRDRGVLTEADGHWSAAQSITSIEQEIPPSARSLIQRTIDRLDDSHRQLLIAASVQGYDFDASVIARALEQDAADVEDRFDLVERTHGLIRCVGEKELPNGTLTLAYRFVHVLYQNALYGSLKPARRASLSSAIANALVGFYGTKATNIAAALALLFEAAREPSPAADYLLLAAQNAARVFAGEEAIALARRGLAVLAKLPPSLDRSARELRFQVVLAAALAARKGYSDPDVEQANNRTHALCLEVGDVPEKFSALYGVYTFFFVRANFPASLEILDQLLQIAVAERNPTRLVIAHMGYVGPLLQSGDFNGALKRLDESLRSYDPAAYHPHLEMFGADPRTTVSIWFGLALWFAGRVDQSLERAQESVALATQTGQPLTLTYVFTMMAWLHTYRREPEAVERCAGKAIALCREHGFNQWLAVAAIHHGWARAHLGHAAEALPAMQYALAAYRAAGGVMLLPQLLATVAEASIRAGDPVAPMRIVTDALDVVRSTGERCWEADLHRLRGELLSAQPGRDAEGELSLQRALEVARELGAHVLELRAATSWARQCRRQGREEEGLRLVADIYGRFTEGFDTTDLREARHLLDARDVR